MEGPGSLTAETYRIPRKRTQYIRPKTKLKMYQKNKLLTLLLYEAEKPHCTSSFADSCVAIVQTKARCTSTGKTNGQKEYVERRILEKWRIVKLQDMW
jgi:hypothetical protein